jgi:hypothetical protein
MLAARHEVGDLLRDSGGVSIVSEPRDEGLCFGGGAPLESPSRESLLLGLVRLYSRPLVGSFPPCRPNEPDGLG